MEVRGAEDEGADQQWRAEMGRRGGRDFSVIHGKQRGATNKRVTLFQSCLGRLQLIDLEKGLVFEKDGGIQNKVAYEQ